MLSIFFTDFDVKIFEENFGKIDLEPKLQRIFDKTKPTNLTRNWYYIQNQLLLIYNLNKDFSNPSFLFLLINCMNEIFMVCLNKK